MIAEGRDEEYDYIETHGPGFLRDGDPAGTFQVGTTIVPVGSVIGCAIVDIYRKLVAGSGTITSMKFQGRRNSSTGWVDIVTLANDTATAQAIAGYLDFRWEVIVATATVDILWYARFATVDTA